MYLYTNILGRSLPYYPIITFDHKVADKLSIPHFQCLIGQNPHDRHVVFFYTECKENNDILLEYIT